MNERTKIGLEILQASAVIGILGNVLLRMTPWGLNVFLFVGIFVIAMIALGRRKDADFLTRHNIALFGAMIFFAAMFVWRDAIQLKLLDTVAIIAAMSILILPKLKIAIPVAGAFHYVIGFLWASISSLFFAPVLAFDIKWDTIPQTGTTKHIVAALRGLLIATPIVLIFGALFVAADSVYQGWVERVFNVPSDVIVTNVLLSAVLAWLTAGYFRGALLGQDVAASIVANDTATTTSDLSAFERIQAEDVVNPDTLQGNASILEHINRTDEPNDVNAKATEAKPRRWQDFDSSWLPKGFHLGTIEVSIILGLINLLFLSFVVVQIPYLFGGMELVQNTPDFKLSEYARRGFGELVTVGALVLPILLASHWLLSKENPLTEKIFRVLAGVQIVLLFVIMASAGQRLFLLTGSLGYGLTSARLYPMIFMVWLGIVLLWFAATVLRGSRQYFAWGALWAAFIVLGATHILNPDDLIARTNVGLMEQGRAFDADYNSKLSDDALPTLVRAFNKFEDKDAEEFFQRWQGRYCAGLEEHDLRSWNVSRDKAAKILAQYSNTLTRDIDCEQVNQRYGPDEF